MRGFPQRFLRRSRLFILFVVIAQLSAFNAQLSAAVFTSNIVITEADTSYDGQDIVIDGATVAIDGPHLFNSLLLTNGAVLTHSPCGACESHKLASCLLALDGVL